MGVTRPALGEPARSTRGSFSALSSRNYRLLLTGVIISSVGTWMQTASQAWLIHQLTGRATDLGVLGLARAVPLIVLSLVGGTLADRLDKRRLLYVTQTLAAAFAIIQGLLAQAGVLEVWHIWVLGFLSATVLAFDQPTRQAMLPALVPREDFMSAITLNALTFNGAAVLGPAIAGLVVPVAGYAWTFYLNGISFAAVIVALVLMRLPAPPPRPREAGVLRGVADGLRYIWRNPTVRALTVMAAAFGLFGSPYVLMLPVYRPLLDLDERALGLLSSAPGLGAVLGGLVLARFAHVRWKGRLLVGSVGLFVITLITFATSRSYGVSLAVLVAVGASLTAFTTTTQTLLQRATDDRMRGRVVSMFTTTIIGFQPLGALDLGWAIDQVGAPAALSAAALVVGAVALALTPRLRRQPDW